MPGERSFRLGYSVISWGDTPDLDQVLGVIGGAGWQGVEFIGVSLDWLGTPRHLRSVLDRHQVPPVCMFGSVSLGDDAAKVLERQRRLIEFASELGCSVYAFLGGQRVVRRLPTDDEFKRLAEQADTLIEYATPFGLTVAYHAHPRCTVESEAEQDRLLGYCDRLQVCVDVSVAALMGEDAVAQLEKYRDRLAYVHLKDWTKGKFCLMGQGSVGLDFRSIRETLNAIGYQGWVMGELSSYADTDATDSCYLNHQYLQSVGY
jgi:inosose dehydratase